MRCGALRGSRTHAATASTSRPASTGADQALTAYSRPIDSAVASASATTRRRGAIAGPTSATWTTRASASSVTGSARKWAWRSPTRKENHGNSLIVSGTTRDASNQG